MPAATATGADRLLEPWFTALRERLPGLRMFDCHTHLGCADPDRSCFDAEEFIDLPGIPDALPARTVC